MSKNLPRTRRRRGGNTEGDHAERKVMVAPECRVETCPVIGGGVSFVDSAREKTKRTQWLRFNVQGQSGISEGCLSYCLLRQSKIP